MTRIPLPCTCHVVKATHTVATVLGTYKTFNDGGIETLIYLPATFTSTFCSTDVVKYQDTAEADGTRFSKLALMRWLQVTLPLTAITLFVAWLAYKMHDTCQKGMTIFERIKSFSSPAKPRFMPHGARASTAA